MLFFFSSRRRHTRYWRDWSSDVCSSDLSDDRPGRRRDLHEGRPSSGGGNRCGGGTTGQEVPLPCLHNYTGGEWSRLRSGDQGKRAEEADDELVNHASETTQAPTREIGRAHV